MKNSKVVIIVIIVIILSGAVGYFLTVNKASDTNIIDEIDLGQSLNEFSQLVSISPDGTHVLYVSNNTDGSYHSLKYQNLQTSENKIFDTISVSSKYYDFIWYGNNRVYYAIGGELNNGYTTFYYHDFNSVDPNAVTGIVFEDPDLIMQGEVGIAGVGEDILYVQKDSKIYSINLKDGPGAQPIFVIDLDQ